MCASHTPGPWEIRTQGNVIGQADGPFVVGLNDVSPADADLIATAPELLEEVRKAAITFAELATTFGLFGYPTASAACRVAEKSNLAIIAKATGAAP